MQTTIFIQVREVFLINQQLCARVKEKVLVVDDEQIHLETVQLYLNVAGYEVICATDIRSAWRLVLEEKPELVILDMVIPGGSGLELMDKINREFPHIGVVIMTAYGNEDVAASTIKLGALDYIRKPVQYNSLSHVVEKALNKQRELQKQAASVNDLKHAYEALQVSAESILSCISAGVVAVDKNLNIRMINEKAKEFLDISEENIQDNNFYEVFPFFNSSRLLKYTLENNRGVQLYETEIHTANGNKILNMNTDVIYDHQSNPIGAVAVFNDVTELRHKEYLLQEKEKLAIVGQMAACMAHEIKNPLTAIKGFGQILTSKIKDDSLVEYLEIMNSEINRMSQVIQDFLLLASPKQPQFVKAEINQLIRETMLIIESQVLLKNIQVVLALSENIPLLMVDSSKIKQVLLNLTQNALEAMENGDELTITTSYLPGQKEIRLDVRDTGCGIPKEKIKELGVPFTTTKPTGTGLGLSITYTIIEQHKGRVKVQSEVGQGTIFSVYLPIGNEHDK